MSSGIGRLSDQRDGGASVNEDEFARVHGSHQRDVDGLNRTADPDRRVVRGANRDDLTHCAAL